MTVPGHGSRRGRSATPTTATVLSIRLATVADVVASAAPSVAIARTSITPSGNVPVAAEQVKGAALAVQKSVQVPVDAGRTW